MSDLQNKQQSSKESIFSLPIQLKPKDYHSALGLSQKPASFSVKQSKKNCLEKNRNKNSLTPQQFKRAQEIFMRDVIRLEYLEKRYGIHNIEYKNGKFFVKRLICRKQKNAKICGRDTQ